MNVKNSKWTLDREVNVWWGRCVHGERIRKGLKVWEWEQGCEGKVNAQTRRNEMMSARECKRKEGQVLRAIGDRCLSACDTLAVLPCLLPLSTRMFFCFMN
mmetsp:Transcript_14181/g.28441  ORF Transcript_14181/g.28441 Transcript_14181/m.28441 type:complete len:101 (-) Transcript_14181:312-614(-)